MPPYWVLAAYAAGIGLSAWLPSPDRLGTLGAAASLALAWLLLCRSRLVIAPLALALVLAGFLWAHWQMEPPRHSGHVAQLASGATVALEGVVRQAERLWDGSTRLDVAIDRVGSTGGYGVVRLTIRNGRSDAEPGDRVCWTGRLRRPALFGTPGEFNYPRYLAARDIYATSSIDRATDLARMAPEPAARKSFLTRWRHRVAAAIADTLPPEQSGLVQALTVGIGTGVTPEQRRQLSAGGLSHLFAISGLHFGLLAFLLYGICRWLYGRSQRLLLATPPRRVLPLLLLAPLAGYLFLSGNAVPTRRAYFMTALGALQFSCHRRTAPLALLATVALAMLISSPLSLFEASFQLSFAGVLGLVVWLPRWQGYLAGRPAVWRTSGMLFLTTLAASLATAPFALWHFHQVAPAGLVTNLVAVPLIAWGAVPAGLLGALLVPLAPQSAGLCFAGCGTVVALTLRLTALLLDFPGLTALTLFVNGREWCGTLALLAAGLLPPGRRRLAGTLLAIGIVLVAAPALPGPPLQVTALSVGQGDATILSFPAGRHYLVDGGGLTGSAVDIGERLVGPALGRLGVRHLSGVILTHNHPDHSAGLVYIVDHFRVDGFWSAIPAGQFDPRLAAALQRRQIPVHHLAEGWTPLAAPRPATLQVYVPPQEADDPNERSIVVHAAVGESGALLTGDLAVAGFVSLCAAGVPEPVNLLKLPHHGSRGSRPELFLDRFAPRLAFVSAGRDNPYGLPHPTSIAACSNRNIALYRTDHHGTLTFTSSGQGWQVQCFGGVSH